MTGPLIREVRPKIKASEKAFCDDLRCPAQRRRLRTNVARTWRRCERPATTCVCRETYGSALRSAAGLAQLSHLRAQGHTEAGDSRSEMRSQSQAAATVIPASGNGRSVRFQDAGRIGRRGRDHARRPAAVNASALPWREIRRAEVRVGVTAEIWHRSCDKAGVSERLHALRASRAERRETRDVTARPAGGGRSQGET